VRFSLLSFKCFWWSSIPCQLLFRPFVTDKMRSTFVPRAFSVLSSLVLLSNSAVTAATDAAACPCGFYDAVTKNVFTESTIIYFNETDHIPNDALVVQSFEHRYDNGWNTLYRKGASPSNVDIVYDTTAQGVQSLALYCDPSTPDHLVQGASLRTARQDIFYGSFRTTMRSPRERFPGSVLSMTLDYNLSESWSVNLMNTDHHEYAWVSMLAKGAFPNLWFGVNYTTLEDEGMSPWYYTEYRVDWTPESIKYYIGGRIQQSNTKELNGTLPSTPSALQWQHWSTGDAYASQGPPIERGEANVKTMRLFFNSSTMTTDQHQEFDTRCQPSLACSMDDWSLRGSTAYPEAATRQWVQQNPVGRTHWIPIFVDAAFGFLSTMLLAKTLSRRISWSKILRKVTGKGEKEQEHELKSRVETARSEATCSSPHLSGASTPAHTSGRTTPTLVSGSRTPMHGSISSWHNMSEQINGRFPPGGSHQGQIEAIINSYQGRNSVAPYRINASDTDNPFLSGQEKSATDSSAHQNQQVQTSDPTQPTAPSKVVPRLPSWSTQRSTISEEGKSGVEVTVIEAIPNSAKAAANTTTIPTKHVDYLAGFIAISAILVTMNHFGLTYWAAVT
jgi:hypothetical protein